MRDADWYQTALAIVTSAHGDALDPLGRPAVAHFERVAARVAAMFPNATRAQIQAALLHDVLEFGAEDIQSLRTAGIDEAALDILQCIKIPPDCSYLDYMRRLAATGHVAAMQVKLADLVDNSDPALLARMDGGESLMESKFLPSRQILEAALKGTQWR